MSHLQHQGTIGLDGLQPHKYFRCNFFFVNLQKQTANQFVVGSVPGSECFFSSCSGFPLSSKPNTSKFQFDQESGRWRTTMWMCYLQIVIYFILVI